MFNWKAPVLMLVWVELDTLRFLSYRFGQLQAVDLESIEPSLRAGIHLRPHAIIGYHSSLCQHILI
jgi:hypothetical protein